MAEQDDIRTDLDVELFSVYGKTITFKKKSSPTYNTWGDLDQVTSTQSTITIVPFNITHEERQLQESGILPAGDMQAAVPYDVDVDTDDIFVIESEGWRVTTVTRNYLPDNVATIVMLARDPDVLSELSPEALNLLEAGGDQLLDANSDTLKVTS